MLRGRVVRALTHPVVAAAVNAGGMWLLYTTDLYRLMHTSVVVHALVHTHIVLAGYVLTGRWLGGTRSAPRAGRDARGRAGRVYRRALRPGQVLRAPPDGVDVGDGRVGAQLMYYGGDVVDAIIIVLLLAGWYTRPILSGPARHTRRPDG